MIDSLREIALFANLDSYQLQNIADKCTLRTYKAGTILFRENEPGTVFYLVVSGTVKIFTSNSRGEDKIMTILSTGDSFGELSLLDGRPRSATAQAIEETTVISLAAKSFQVLLKTHFDLNLSILKQLSIRLRETNQQVHDLTYMDARQRVVKNLIKLANDHGTRGGTMVKFQINLNYDELSQLAGVAKPLVFQVLAELQNKRILTVSGNTYLLDLRQL
ncbi:Crp/Fnr family transcriptional regulator [Paenibacillus koleovorans]|uniref:Crp/Fnr family transcriptional regulator n=1 Tax=Paenibacillus koleovorans TaxID=121608 RepID=UPI0013E37169|nr:Crp/Fnr family transcriptional regulator [Paenibacillus koleovorans]